MYSVVTIRTGKLSTYVHENRHTRQSSSMSLYDSELEAHIYQRIFSFEDVQRKIDNEIYIRYIYQGLQPPMNYGLPEYINDVYINK